MPSEAGLLLTAARHTKRPRWSQQFLAEEIAEIGIPLSRSQIARAERSEAGTYNCETMIALAMALAVPHDEIMDALLADLETVYKQVEVTLGHDEPGAFHLPVRRHRHVAPPRASDD